MFKRKGRKEGDDVHEYQTVIRRGTVVVAALVECAEFVEKESKEHGLAVLR